MKRIVIILAVVALMGTAIGAVFASAAGLTVAAPASLGSGSPPAAVAACSDVESIAWVLDGADPTKVASADLVLDNGAGPGNQCVGATAHLIAGGETANGGVVTPVSGKDGEVSLTFATQPLVSAITTVTVVLNGP